MGIIGADAAGVLPGGAAAQAAESWGYPNGQIPASAMSPVPADAGPYLRSDAAAAYFRLNDAFQKQFGKPLGIKQAYRDLKEQEYFYDQFLHHAGNPAAIPGTSPHGYALACDFKSRVNAYGTPEKKWMDAQAPSFGWIPTGNTFKAGHEPWHFEYMAGSYTPPTSPLYNQKDGEMSYTVRNTTTGGIYTMAAQFIKHEPSTVSGQTTANITTQDDQIIALDDTSFKYFLDSLGVPQNVIPTNGGIWSRELEILQKLDQIIAKNQ
jgi:hypothetical protein